MTTGSNARADAARDGGRRWKRCPWASRIELITMLTRRRGPAPESVRFEQSISADGRFSQPPAERPCSCPGASSIRPRGQRQPWATGEPGRRGSSPRAATSTAGMAAGLGHVGVGALLATRVGRRSRRADEHRARRRANQQSSGPDRPRSGLLDPRDRTGPRRSRGRGTRRTARPARPDRPVQPAGRRARLCYDGSRATRRPMPPRGSSRGRDHGARDGANRSGTGGNRWLSRSRASCSGYETTLECSGS